MSPLLAAFALAAQTPAPIELPFRTVAFGANGTIKDGGAIVIRDGKEFDAYRKRMNATDSKKPKIDWSKEQIVAIHAVGVGYGGASLQVSKVRKTEAGLEVEASLEQGSRPAVPAPGMVRVLRKEGIYVLIVVPPAKGEVTLRVIDPPRDRGGKTGSSGLR